MITNSATRNGNDGQFRNGLQAQGATMTDTAIPTPRFRGPSLILLATVHILIFEAGFVAAMVLRHGAPFVTPFGPAEELHKFLAQSPTAVRVSNFFLFGAALPLGIFAV